jgi:hypothetical protein
VNRLWPRRISQGSAKRTAVNSIPQENPRGVKTEISPKAPTSSARASRKLRTAEAGMHPWCHHPAAMLAAVVAATRTGAGQCSPSRRSGDHQSEGGRRPPCRASGTVVGMKGSGRSPRIWIDFEQGADYGSSAASVEAFAELRGCFRTFTEAWLFRGRDAPLVRGFYYPLSSHIRFGIPKDLGPLAVLIDECGDQLWLNAVSCGDGDSAAAASTLLNTLDFVVPAGSSDVSALHGCDEMHFVDRKMAGTRLFGEPTPVPPPGKTFVHGGRLICRMEFDKGGVSAADLRKLWTMATEPDCWLGRIAELTCYDSRIRSEKAGHDGCQLIAVGESERELWLRLPEPDDYDRLSGRRRDQYEGSYTEYQAVVQAIFYDVGIDIDPPDDRPWRERILGQHRPPPEVIHWP